MAAEASTIVQDLDVSAKTPVFEQIVDQIRQRVVTGELPAGTKLPAVRALAADLGVAVNTVAKAYRRLEAEGTVITSGRNGTVVESLADTQNTELNDAVQKLIVSARQRGLTKDQTMGMIARLW